MKKLLATTAILAICTFGVANATPVLDATETSKVEQMAKDAIKKGDTDGDGYLSKTEFETMMDQMFTDADTNGDGQLTMAEVKAEKTKEMQTIDSELGKSTSLSANETEKVGMMTADVMKKADTNGDNMISRAEHAAYADKMFADADSNNDGKLSMDEIQSAKMKYVRSLKTSKDDTVHGNVDTRNAATK